MRRFVWLAFVVLLPGCALQTSEPVKEMPKFGSAPKYATTGGFVAGRWRLFMDDSTARYHVPDLGKAILSSMREELEMTADGRVVFLFEGHKAHGHWSTNGNGIDLSFDDVDGFAAAEAHAKYQKYLDGSRWYRRFRQVDYTRGVTLDLANGIKRLELHEDQKRLFQPIASMRSDGTAFMGTPTWLRE